MILILIFFFFFFFFFFVESLGETKEKEKQKKRGLPKFDKKNSPLEVCERGRKGRGKGKLELTFS